MLPILFLLLLVCDIRALTLQCRCRRQLLFRPDFSKLTPGMFLAALGLSFFKMSVCMGVMTTCGSYMGPEDNLPSSMLKVALSDTLVSIMAGLAIFPAVFAFGYQPDAGPSLLSIPMVFNSMPLGQLFLTLFFLLAAIATGAMILMEVPKLIYQKKRIGPGLKPLWLCSYSSTFWYVGHFFHQYTFSCQSLGHDFLRFLRFFHLKHPHAHGRHCH